MPGDRRGSLRRTPQPQESGLHREGRALPTCLEPEGAVWSGRRHLRGPSDRRFELFWLSHQTRTMGFRSGPKVWICFMLSSSFQLFSSLVCWHEEK